MKALGDDADLGFGVVAAGDGLPSFAGDALGVGVAAYVDEPLHTDQRLNDGGATLAVAYGMAVGFRFFQGAEGLEFGDDLAAGFEALYAGVFAGDVGHQAILADDVGGVEAVALAYLEVYRVVGGGDFEGAGAEIGVDGFVADYRDGAVHYGQDDAAAADAVVAGILGVDRNAGVAKHSFGAGGGDGDGLGGVVLEGIADVVQVAVDILIVDFKVGQGGGATDAAVDNALVAVDQPFVVKADERWCGRRRWGRGRG